MLKNINEYQNDTERYSSRWDDEGGAAPCGPQESLAAACEKGEIPALSNAELIQLRIRVIALENILISMLSKASDDQLMQIGAMAEFITPRPDATQHPLTVHAATQMTQLVERAKHFRS